MNAWLLIYNVSSKINSVILIFSDEFKFDSILHERNRHELKLVGQNFIYENNSKWNLVSKNRSNGLSWRDESI